MAQSTRSSFLYYANELCGTGFLLLPFSSETLCLIDFACELGSNVVDQAFSRIVSIVRLITHSVLLKLISVPLRLLCTLGYAYRNRQTKEVYYMGGLGCPCYQKLYLRKLQRM